MKLPVPESSFFLPNGFIPEEDYMDLLKRKKGIYTTLERFNLSNYVVFAPSLKSNIEVWSRTFQNMERYGVEPEERKFGKYKYYKMKPTEASSRGYPWIQLYFDDDFVKYVKQYRDIGDRRIEHELVRLGVKMDQKGRWQVGMHILCLTAFVCPKPLSPREIALWHNWVREKGGFKQEKPNSDKGDYIARHYKTRDTNNFSVWNLQWGTHKANAKDKTKHYSSEFPNSNGHV